MTQPAIDGLLTAAELHAMDLTVELVNLMCCDVIGCGASRAGDVAELAASIHHIQQQILSQAAARAYPDRFRLLGGTVPP